MNNDLISRQEAIEAMTNTLWHYPNECYRNLNEYQFAKGLAELGLKSVPSVQPEVIHCGECRYYKDVTSIQEFLFQIPYTLDLAVLMAHFLIQVLLNLLQIHIH